MDSKYQHPSIQLFIMGLKPSEGNAETTSHGLDQKIDEAGTTDNNRGEDTDGDNSSGMDGLDDSGFNKAEDDSILVSSTQNEKLSEWEARRFGSMAARLLRDVRIT